MFQRPSEQPDRRMCLSCESLAPHERLRRVMILNPVRTRKEKDALVIALALATGTRRLPENPSPKGDRLLEALRTVAPTPPAG
jgi:hypothetical protein